MKLNFKTFAELKNKTIVLFRELDVYEYEIKRLLHGNSIPYKELGDYKIIPDEESRNFKAAMKDKDFVQAYEAVQERIQKIKDSCGVETSKTEKISK
jgi:hypothetical protein